MRSSRWPTGIALLLICAAAVCAAGRAGAATVSSCSRHEEVFCSETCAVSILHLAHRQIIAASETVYVDGVRYEKGLHYDMDYTTGLVNVRGGLAPGSCLKISYRVFPFLFKGDYCLRRLNTVRKDGSRPSPDGEDAGQAVPLMKDTGYSLRASGSKTVAMEAGTLGGVKIDQSLSLSLGGNIGKSVSVVGVLSDKDFGFDGAGQTQRLADLDKVFIEVQSPRAMARVGDIEMAQAPGELLNFERSMTGFYASASRGESGLRASAASSRTTTESAVIEGREGVSGPYAVTDSDGRPVSILPDKERVWLDGIAMRRGKGMDYTVDYAAGAIYFNPSRFIRAGSRIVIDYEVTDYDGGRQFYFAGSDLHLSDNASVGVTVVNERFSPAVLTGDGDGSGGVNLGSDGEDGYTDGGRYVGPGKGDYVRAEVDSAYFYEYVGDFMGDYEVTFSRVEDGEGDYAYIYSEVWQKHIYLHVAGGDYVAMLGPAPELSSQVVHVAGTGRLGDRVELKAEGALSRAGEKSGGGSWEDVRDGAYAVRLNGETPEIHMGGVDVGALEFEVNRRSVGPAYETFGRIRNPGFLETWGVKPTSVYEESDGVNIGYRIGSGLRADAGMGRMETDAGSSMRRHARVALGNQRLGLTAMTDVVDVAAGEGDRGITRRGIDLRVPVSFALANAGNRFEERVLEDGGGSFKRNEVYSEIRLPGAARSLRVNLARTRESRMIETAWADYSTVTEGRVEFEARKGTLLQVRGVVGQSRVAYAEDVGLSDQTSTACDLALSFRDLYMLSALTLDYGLATTLTTLYETELIKVETGGDYDSLGNYVEDGGYTVSRREAGRTPVTRLRSRLLMETGRSGKILHKRRFTTRTEIAVEGESVDASLRRAALPGLGELMHGETVMFGRVTASEQIVLNRVGNNTISANLRGTRGQDRRCEDRLETIAQDQVQVRLMSNAFKRFTLAVEGELRSSRRSLGTGPRAVDRDISARSVRMDIERPLMQSLRALLSVRVQKEISTAPVYDVTQADLSPGLTLYAGSLRCDARANVRRILGGESTSAAGYARQNSIDWNARFSYNHTRFTSISVEYTGTRLEHSPAIHNLRASVNATF
ncbi:MAG: hypothetical protein PVJ42_10965 [bacterium]